MVERAQVEKLVQEKLAKYEANTKATEPTAATTIVPSSPAAILDFVNETTIRDLGNDVKVIYVTPRAVVTPLAKDLAAGKGLQIKIAVGEVTNPRTANPKSIAIGTDHGGFEMKEALKKEIRSWGYEVVDVGTNSTESVDYPDFAHAVAVLVAKQECILGIIIDGAGIGSAMVANKVPGIRAAHCTNLYEVKNSREHNNANILTLGAKVIGMGVASELVKSWLETPFAGGRHQRRVDKITTIEQNYTKRA